MRDSVRRTRHGTGIRVAIVCLVWATWTIAALGQAKPYTAKNGVLNWKAVLIGGSFRVTTAIPLHGDFTRYTQLQIVRARSLIGSNVPVKVLDQLTRGLVDAFQESGRFSGTVIVDGLSLPVTRPTADPDTPMARSFRDADPLDAPMRRADDLVMFDRQRQAMAHTPETTFDDTLVVQCEVIDYAKGNKWLQLLFLDLGNAVLTLRFSYFDLASGEELGRSVISSDNSSTVVPSVFSARTALTGVIEGLVDQVSRRKIGGER